MMKEASGKDEILQEKEFSRWSRRHTSRVNKWIENSLEAGRDSLEEASLIEGQRYTPKGQAEARKLLGFKKFLNDFTLVGERTSREVGLWQDYLVFASIFGIADKVAKELHDIDPQFFEEVMAYDFNTVNWILWRNSMLSNSITNAQVRAADAMSRSSGSFGVSAEALLSAAEAASAVAASAAERVRIGRSKRILSKRSQGENRPRQQRLSTANRQARLPSWLLQLPEYEGRSRHRDVRVPAKSLRVL